MTPLKPLIEGKYVINGSPLYGANPLKLPIKINPILGTYKNLIHRLAKQFTRAKQLRSVQLIV